MLQKIDFWLANLLDSYNVTFMWLDPLSTLIKLVIALIFSYLLFLLTNQILIALIRSLSQKTETLWDDILIEQHVFNRLSYLVPAYALSRLSPMVFSPYPEWSGFFLLVLKIFSIWVVIRSFSAFFNAILEIYKYYPASKTRPIKGYIQLAKILLYLIATVVIISVLFGQNPLVMIGGLGAFSAVLLLVFKDSILGLVAGVQLTANDMLRPGDWISFPKYDADGTVIDITLTTVKVQNWDRTYSTIPAYALFSESFKNWRGMEESDGRRIKRAINIDMNSVKFCTPEMLKKFEKIHYLTRYIKDKELEINEYNSANNIDPDIPVNGRRQTNLGVFRNYIFQYLLNHPKINPEMPLSIRYLQPTETGIPVEIYAFTREKGFANYEPLQADIFDHLLAIIPEFGLKVFQNPSGSDFRALVTGNETMRGIRAKS